VCWFSSFRGPRADQTRTKTGIDSPMASTVPHRERVRWLLVEADARVGRLPSLLPTKDAPPARHRGAETFVFGLRDAEVSGGEPLERRQSLEEADCIEARVLLGRQLEQPLELEAPGQLGQVRKSRASARSKSARTLLAASSRTASVGP